ncbi:hypothetical protein NWF22_16335 [Gordonia mangrovi]|nr:hypothetical protein [Gordonia mangrovi]UVF80943.1 hypothetical protein NWF22_16335 [Gordonia mangrovi]
MVGDEACHAHFVASLTPDHRSLEDITLHPQLGDLLAQPFELDGVVCGQLTAALSLGARPLDPVAQRALVDPHVPGDLSDRLTCLFDDPNSSQKWHGGRLVSSRHTDSLAIFVRFG